MTPEIQRASVAEWPRLMREVDAARYLSIGTTTLREIGPAPKHIGRSVRWDRRDLDRWADRLDEQPLDAKEELDEAAEVERRFMEKRRARG